MVTDSDPHTLTAVPDDTLGGCFHRGEELGFGHGRQSERERVLNLLERTLNRIRQAKGRGWESELERLQDDVGKGTQMLDYDPAPDPRPEVFLASGVTEKGRMHYRKYEERFGRAGTNPASPTSSASGETPP